MGKQVLSLRKRNFLKEVVLVMAHQGGQKGRPASSTEDRIINRILAEGSQAHLVVQKFLLMQMTCKPLIVL